MLTDAVINDLKSFDWKKILGMDLKDLDNSQWRFLKGLVVERTVEKYSGKDGLVYVGDIHKDYNWPKHNVTVELKSQLSNDMYGVRGLPCKNFTIKLNNSNGTNNKDTLSPSDVADILLVVRNNGAFAIDRDTVMKKAKKGGDGFEVKVHRDEITEITGKLIVEDKTKPNFRAAVDDLVKSRI